MSEQLEIYHTWLREGRYVCVDLVTIKRGRHSVFGKIIKIDNEKEQILIYDDDFKRVETASFAAIDDIKAAK